MFSVAWCLFALFTYEADTIQPLSSNLCYICLQAHSQMAICSELARKTSNGQIAVWKFHEAGNLWGNCWGWRNGADLLQSQRGDKRWASMISWSLKIQKANNKRQMQKKTPVIKVKMNQKPRRTKQEHGEYMRTEEQAREHRRHRRANTEENTGLDKQAVMSTDGHRKMSFSGIFSTLTIDDQVTPLQHSKLKFLQCNFWHLFNFS